MNGIVNGKTLIFVIVSLLILLIVLLQIQRYLQKKEERFTKTIKSRGKGKNKLYFAYKFFTKTPFINKYFAKVLRNTESIYPSDPISVNKAATEMMIKTISKSVLIIIASVILAGGDLVYTLIGIMTALVLFNHSIMRKFENQEFILLTQLQSFISDIRHYYMATPIVEDAIANTLDDIPYEISLHVEKIHEMIISPEMEEKVEEYTSSAPNRFFLLLTSICSSIKEYGDTTLEDGSSNFLTSLSYLKEEINVEILKKKRIKHAFFGLEMMSLIIVFFLKPIEAWAISNMPDLKDFYAGTYGKVLIVTIFILSFVCYYLVDVLRNSRKEDIKQRNIFSRLANIPLISPILNKIINKNYTWALDINDRMKEIGDQTGPKAFLLKKIIFAIGTFICINFVFSTNVIQQRLTMISQYVAEFDSAIVPNEKYLKNMQDASNEFAKKYSKTNANKINREEMTQEIVNTTGVKNFEYAGMIADSVITQINKYQNTYFKWYYLIVALAGTVIGFCIPNGFLKFKIKVSSMNKDDEINQFQTLILILMNVPGIQLKTILEWMDRFSYAFKASLEDCIIELESGEKTALEHLKNQEEYIPFKRFVDCLLTIDDSGVTSAFDEILVDRTYSLKEREQSNIINVENKASLARKIAYAPLMTEIVCYLIIPMFILAGKMFLSMDFSM